MFWIHHNECRCCCDISYYSSTTDGCHSSVVSYSITTEERSNFQHTWVRVTVHDLRGKDEGEKAMQNRVQVINVRRPTGSNPVTKKPLMICDYRSVNPDEDVHSYIIQSLKQLDDHSYWSGACSGGYVDLLYLIIWWYSFIAEQVAQIGPLAAYERNIGVADKNQLQIRNLTEVPAWKFYKKSRMNMIKKFPLDKDMFKDVRMFREFTYKRHKPWTKVQ